VPERTIRRARLASRDPVIFLPGGERIPWPPSDDRLSEGLRSALASAQDHAARLGHNHVGPVHLLLGLVGQTGEPAGRHLEESGVTLESALAAMDSVMGPSTEPIEPEDITIVPRSQRVMDIARREASKLERVSTGTEHLLSALLLENEHFTKRLFAALGVDTAALLEKTHLP
jgi:ATP-dependent Clp protease ATP-binding subunit ClpC